MLKYNKDDGREVAICDFAGVYEVSSAVGFRDAKMASQRVRLYEVTICDLKDGYDGRMRFV